MKRNFTIEDLFLYHSNELPKEEIPSFELSLQFDESLIEANRDLQSLGRMLDKQKAKPSEASIRLIMDYNRQSSGELETI